MYIDTVLKALLQKELSLMVFTESHRIMTTCSNSSGRFARKRVTTVETRTASTVGPTFLHW